MGNFSGNRLSKEVRNIYALPIVISEHTELIRGR